ncbi:MAG: hypothetical protein JKY49_13015 [Cohaesibacteraceae bacterium]|nr:hypothetical protein [Cohaesibacteraceae bacterium]
MSYHCEIASVVIGACFLFPASVAFADAPLDEEIKACEAGSADGCFNTENGYANGTGVSTDQVRAT